MKGSHITEDMFGPKAINFQQLIAFNALNDTSDKKVVDCHQKFENTFPQKSLDKRKYD